MANTWKVRTATGAWRGVLTMTGLAVGFGALSACSAAPTAPAPMATVTVTAIPATAAPPVQAASSAPAASAPAMPASPSASATAVTPTLGEPAGVFTQGQGFGEVRPATVFNGGDPTVPVTHINWTSWGGHRAVGTGVSDYVGPGQSVATGSQETARIVAFHLGMCGGRLMYRAVEWYFPGEGQSFDPARYEDICVGAYVPAP